MRLDLLEEDLEREDEVVDEVVVESFVFVSSGVAEAPAIAAEMESSSDADVAIVCGSELTLVFGFRGLLGFFAVTVAVVAGKSLD
jgi:hypothetical protein